MRKLGLMIVAFSTIAFAMGCEGDATKPKPAPAPKTELGSPSSGIPSDTNPAPASKPEPAKK